MATIVVAYQGTISIECGISRVKLVVHKSTIRKNLFYSKKIASYSLICMHTQRKKEYLCMVAKTEWVLTYPDISLISYGNRSAHLIIINVILGWRWDAKELPGWPFITCLIYPIAILWNILFAVQLNKSIILQVKIIRILAKVFVLCSRNTFVVRSKIHRYSNSYGPIKILWK